MAKKRMDRVPVREQDPKARATNFEEVCYGYNEAEAVEEANRCLNCKKPRCVAGCPVSIDIPGFIHEVTEKNYQKAFEIIQESSLLPAVCGRVCPQESQCEGPCVMGIKGDAVAIGKLERFVADGWRRGVFFRVRKGAVPTLVLRLEDAPTTQGSGQRTAFLWIHDALVERRGSGLCRGPGSLCGLSPSGIPRQAGPGSGPDGGVSLPRGGPAGGVDTQPTAPETQSV